MQWDVFISHASEDKSDVARPLAAKLHEHGLRVWLDEQELLLGDSLRRKIDEGLSRSRWGVLVLSRHFLEKEWPQAELDGLLARELAGEKVILPVWHGITAADVARRSPILAARIAVTTERGLEHVCAAILRVVGRTPMAAEPSEPHRNDLLTLWDSLGERRGGFARADVADALRQREAYADQVVAEYVLKDLVGVGGSGAVFKAVHRTLGSVVALKLLFP
ncbi:MAG TPA: TIR domain-containing protein, partial [Gemmatimonadaceae bacterium]|nr:TIR domain-containing protein [Gemmatimonadaceae bacterium]